MKNQRAWRHRLAAANALAALALCRAIEPPFAPLLQALREFRIAASMEKLAAFSGITFYDDSKAPT